MLHPKIKKLVEEIFADYGEEDEKRAKEYPEVYLLSLLEGIKEELPEVSAMLDFTVEMAGFGSDTDRFQATLVKLQPEQLAVRKTAKKTTKRRQSEMVVA